MTPQLSTIRFGFWGAVSAVLLAFPMAALCALVYRFPVPFSGYESGFAAVPRALGATVFYGIFGGFIVLALGGYVAGVAAVKMAGSNAKKSFGLTLAMSALVALVGAFVLAVLDKIIGPW